MERKVELIQKATNKMFILMKLYTVNNVKLSRLMEKDTLPLSVSLLKDC